MTSKQTPTARDRSGGPLVTADGIRAIVGRISDDRIAAILALRPTAAQVIEAFSWLTSDEYLGGTLERSLSGRVAQIYEILKPAEPDSEEDRTRDV